MATCAASISHIVLCRIASWTRACTQNRARRARCRTQVPWLASHWQENVLDFRAKLARSCRARLRRIGLDAQEYTNLLVSLMLVEGCKAEEMFALVLSNSQSWLSRCTVCPPAAGPWPRAHPPHPVSRE